VSLFGGFGMGPGKKGPFSIFDKGPSTIEKIEMLFKDVETEGKKEGYTRAAKEYKKAFRAIETEYKQTKELFESQKDDYYNLSEKLIAKLEELEKQKISIKKQLERNTKDVSDKFHIPIGDVRKAAMAGTLISPSFGILDIIYKHKEKKLKEAEQRGYLEAKELYESKIAKMRRELQELKKQGHADIKKLLDMISDILDAIAEEQMQIAVLKILL
jgi:hypothetical protein